MGANGVTAQENVAALIERARHGSRSGLGNLLDLFHPALAGVADRNIAAGLKCRMSTSDLVQDTMLTASQQFPAFHGTTEPELRAWLMNILHSRLRDGLRRHRVAERRRQQREVRGSGSQFVDQSSSPSEVVTLDEQAAALVEGFQQLPNELRDILNLRYFEGKTFEAIAELKGLSLATVWRRWAQGVEILKRHLLSTGHD